MSASRLIFQQIDYEKLCKLVGHSNPKSTSNAMAAIKKKLNTMTVAAEDSEIVAPSTEVRDTPSKKKATPRKPKPTPATNGNDFENPVKKEENGDDSGPPPPLAKITPEKITTPCKRKADAAAAVSGNAGEGEQKGEAASTDSGVGGEQNGAETPAKKKRAPATNGVKNSPAAKRGNTEKAGGVKTSAADEDGERKEDVQADVRENVDAVMAEEVAV